MTEYYDDTTLTRVHTALIASGLTPRQALDAINECLNAGILFRETARSAFGCTSDPCPWPHKEKI
jgi:hypothetical protein